MSDIQQTPANVPGFLLAKLFQVNLQKPIDIPTRYDIIKTG